MKIYTLEEVQNKLIGKIGTLEREVFENKLHLDLIREEKKSIQK